MPYHWTDHTDTGHPVAELHLRPHVSLGPNGFVAFFGTTAAMIALPMLTTLGSPVLWGVLPFAALTFWGTWMAVTRNARDAARLCENLTLWPDRITLSHRPARGQPREWEANPHWVRVSLHRDGGPVPDYLTLKGNGREVELGAFLSDTERRALYAELSDRLAALR